MRYFRPKSLTWWSGVFLIVMGILHAAGVPEALGDRLSSLTGVLEALTRALMAVAGGGGDMAPALLIGAGLGLIGHRDAIARNAQAADDNAEARHFELMTRIEAPPPGAASALDIPPDDDLPLGVRDPWGQGGTRE